MIDRYTTGVDNVLVEYTSQIPLQKICSIPFDAEDIKININSRVSDNKKGLLQRKYVVQSVSYTVDLNQHPHLVRMQMHSHVHLSGPRQKSGDRAL